MIGTALSFTAQGASKKLTAAQAAKPATSIAAAKRAGGFVWLGLTNPTESEMEEVGRLYDLHPLAVADAASGKQQPKIQSYPQHLFVVMWALLYKKPEDDIMVGETFLFARPGMLITVERHAKRFSLAIDEVLKKPAEKPAEQLSGGVMSAVYEVMASVARGYTEVSSVIETELEALEEQVFDLKQDDDQARIYGLRKKIGKVNRAVSAISVALTNVRDHFDQLSVGNERIGVYLQDLIDDLSGTDQLTTDQNSALDGVIATHENSIASRQNKDSRRISAIAALIAIPAVVAGLFGMNFKNLPAVSWVYGWELSFAIILVLEVITYVWFRRRKWL